jgi:hypothetical protein
MLRLIPNGAERLALLRVRRPRVRISTKRAAIPTELSRGFSHSRQREIIIIIVIIIIMLM